MSDRLSKFRSSIVEAGPVEGRPDENLLGSQDERGFSGTFLLAEYAVAIHVMQMNINTDQRHL